MDDFSSDNSSSGPRLYGVVDVLRPDRVAGWVIDRSNPRLAATIEVQREGKLVGTVTANRLRKDLERQSVGTGEYGFSFAFEPPLDKGMEFTVAIHAVSTDGTRLPLATAAKAAATVSPEQRALVSILSDISDLRCEIRDLHIEISSSSEHQQALSERIELVQLRLESKMRFADIPPRRDSRWSIGLITAAFVIATCSIITAIFSLVFAG